MSIQQATRRVRKVLLESYKMKTKAKVIDISIHHYNSNLNLNKNHTHIHGGLFNDLDNIKLLDSAFNSLFES